MTRSTFRVLFYANGSKEKNGIVPIMGRVTINGTMAQFSCKRSIAKELWDAKGNRAKGKSMEARETNLALDNIKSFSVFLTTEQGLKNASVWLACMWVKTVVSRAHYNGLIPRNPFAQFRITPNVKEREYLTEGEIRQLVEHEFADATLAFTRDLFVFACFTALSFADIKELTTDGIMDVNGEKWIISKRHKTGVPFQVKLLDIPLQIIGKYRPFQKDNSVFGEINYWNVCKKLKKVISECGINKQISFHCARHTFGTLALSKGMPIESVSRVLGHTNIKTTQIYAKITTQKLGNDLTAFSNQLNQTFGNIKVAGI